MEKIRKPILIVFSAIMILSTFSINSFSQNTDQVIDRITNQFEKFNQTYPKEKIYLHLDKPYYITGETIWHKVYLVNADVNVPSSSSETVYTELINNEGKVIDRQILKVECGFGYGEFLLSGSLPQGTYLVRAYTNWMRNFDQEYFFMKEIQIFNSENTAYDSEVIPLNKAVSNKPATEKIDLQFFPEGGYLISGLTSKVAFKAVNSAGEGIHAKGDIVDKDGKVIIPFESFHLGMGAFLLTPKKGETYFAKLILEQDESIKYALPSILEDGLALTVDNSSMDVIRVVVEANHAFLSDNPKEVLLVLQAAGKIHFTTSGNLHSGSTFVAAIPKERIPAGIAQLTLFNSKGSPECERMIFINPHHPLQIKITSDKNTYHAREKVLVDVSVSDIKGNPVVGNFSLSVTDASQVGDAEKYSDNILTNLLLTSELKGNIEQPAFYFANDDPNCKRALDYLMMTQGWRRYLWKEVLSDHWPAINYNMEKKVLVRKGQVLNTSNDSPVASTRVLLWLLKENESYSRITDEHGFFDFYINDAIGKESIFLDAADENGQHNKHKITIENSSSGYHSAGKLDQLNTNSTIQSHLEKRMERTLIESSFDYSAEKNLIYGTEPEANHGECIAISDFGKADHTIYIDKFNAFTSMSDVFREIVTHVSLKYKKGENKIRVYSDEYMKSFDYQPLFFIDGIPTFSSSMVLNLAPNDIETIEVFRSIRKLRQFGFLGENGVVTIITKKEKSNPALGPENNIIEFQGFNSPKEFYMPEYGGSTKTDKSRPDLRSLLYWNPILKTNSEGKASVSFYNTDNITKINVRLEGISYKGAPGLAGYSYKIKPPE